jgi:hypothetical protein
VVIASGDRLMVTITAKPGCASYNVYAARADALLALNTTTTGSPVEVTTEGAGAPVPTASDAMAFTSPTAVRTAAVSHYTEDVLGGVVYGVRVRSIDRSGNRSDWSTVDTATAGVDDEAPAMPEDVSATALFRGVAVRWSRVIAPDLAYYQVRWSTDSESWERITTTANWAVIVDLDPELTYGFQVRAVDRSGNVVTSDVDDTAVNADANTDAGWTDEVTATPTAIGTADIAAGAIIATHISATGIEAEAIRSGTLTLGGMPSTADLLLVEDSTGTEIGRWDEDGLTVIDPANTDNRLRIMSGVLSFSTDGGTTWTTAISGEGITADAIRLGTSPGGHNLVPNSGFELAEFATALSKVWTSSSDWGTTIGTDVNVTKSGSSLVLTDYTA